LIARLEQRLDLEVDFFLDFFFAEATAPSPARELVAAPLGATDPSASASVAKRAARTRIEPVRMP
jgi:hypothetical protein